MNSSKDFKIGDIVEFAAYDNFEEYEGHANKYYHDIGTVTEVSPRIKVRWKSDGKITDPDPGLIRVLKTNGIGKVNETKENYYLCLTKEEVEIFMNGLSTCNNEYYCSDYDNARSVIEDLLAFKNEAKENNEHIQKALELLSKSGYTCS